MQRYAVSAFTYLKCIIAFIGKAGTYDSSSSEAWPWNRPYSVQNKRAFRSATVTLTSVHFHNFLCQSFCEISIVPSQTFYGNSTPHHLSRLNKPRIVNDNLTKLLLITSEALFRQATKSGHKRTVKKLSRIWNLTAKKFYCIISCQKVLMAEPRQKQISVIKWAILKIWFTICSLQVK